MGLSPHPPAWQLLPREPRPEIKYDGKGPQQGLGRDGRVLSSIRTASLQATLLALYYIGGYAAFKLMQWS